MIVLIRSRCTRKSQGQFKTKFDRITLDWSFKISVNLKKNLRFSTYFVDFYI